MLGSTVIENECLNKESPYGILFKFFLVIISVAYPWASVPAVWRLYIDKSFPKKVISLSYTPPAHKSYRKCSESIRKSYPGRVTRRELKPHESYPTAYFIASGGGGDGIPKM